MTASRNSNSSLVLDISGMSCNHCVARVKKAIDSMPGVQESDVSIGQATVRFDRASVSGDEIAAAITGVGYPAHATGTE